MFSRYFKYMAILFGLRKSKKVPKIQETKEFTTMETLDQ